MSSWNSGAWRHKSPLGGIGVTTMDGLEFARQQEKAQQSMQLLIDKAQQSTPQPLPVGKIEPEVRGSTPSQREQDLTTRVTGLIYVNSQLVRVNHEQGQIIESLQKQLQLSLTLLSQYGQLYGFSTAEVLEKMGYEPTRENTDENSKS